MTDSDIASIRKALWVIAFTLVGALLIAAEILYLMLT